MSGIDWNKAPEGATHYLAYNGCFFEKENGTFYVAGKKAWGKVYTTHSFEAELIPRPSPAWNGEGLPPVGIDIEFKSSGGEWLVGQYIGQFNGKIIAGCHATGVVGYLQSGEMQPIRTPEQIAADEREAAVAAMLELDPYLPNTSLGMMSRADFCRTLYEAGYRKLDLPSDT